MIPVGQLLLDPKNPRLPFAGPGVPQARVREYLMGQGNILELMGAIGELGFQSTEPLLVTAVVPGDPDYVSADAPRYHVVEGNRRLTAVLLLQDPSLAVTKRQATLTAATEARHKPTELPVLVYRRREDLLDYLGYRHVTGTKPWGALEKAIYLDELAKSHGEIDFKALAKTIGSRTDYVGKLFAALNLYRKIEDEGFFHLPGVGRAQINFSIITTALGYTKINEYLGLESPSDYKAEGLDVERLKSLTAWLFQPTGEGKTRLGDSRNLGDLAAVLSDKQALAAFESGRPLSEAVLLTGSPTEVFRKAIADARGRLRDAQANLTHARGLGRPDVSDLDEVVHLSEDLHSAVSRRVRRQSDLGDDVVAESGAG